MPDGVHRSVVTRDGVRLAVSEWGDPAGPEILLVHGLAQSTLSFARQAAGMLGQTHRLVAFDLRGHGLSEQPTDPRFYQDTGRWADDVRTVIEAAGLRRPVLVGWSLGGRVVRAYLARHGDRALAGINFLATRPIEDARVTGPGSLAARPRPGASLAERIEQNLRFLRDCFATPPDGHDLELAIAYNMILPFAARDAIGGWTTPPAEAIATLEAITVPVLITHGRRDRLILPLAAEMTARHVKGARISWYDECGHAPFWEDAPRFNRELAEFVTACATR